MADSNITKRALGNALMTLMEETSFKKISVADICDKCEMNRKSFYYHFKDKYDLVNWIFDTEFMRLIQQRQSDDRWEGITIICRYFYENRNFYYKVLQVQGQNSFSEHFRELLQPLIESRLTEQLDIKELPKICVDFFADGVVCAIIRWLADKDCMQPERFVAMLRKLVEGTAVAVYKEIEQ